MNHIALSPNSPISSAEFQVMDFARAEEVARRHALLIEYLQLKQLDALLLRDPANFAWLTCGGDNRRRGSAGAVASLFLTADARVVLASNVDSGQIFDRELYGMGFQLKERPWTEGRDVLHRDVCRGRKVGCDGPWPDAVDVSADLHSFRTQHGPHEISIFRELGRDLAHALEATARNCERGATEAEVAGHLAHRLLKHQIEPVQLQVMADAQGWRYRHWSYGADRVERHCVLAAVGRRRGLHVGAARTLSFGAPTAALVEAHQLATMVLSSALNFSQAQWTMEQTWQRVARIYEKIGVPDEWRCAEQVDLMGYQPSEGSLPPNSTHGFQPGAALYWHPTVRSALAGDTMLVHPAGGEIITPMQNWPALTVQVKGQALDLPGILIREVYQDSASVLF